MVLLSKLKGVSYYTTEVDALEEGECVFLKIDESSEYDNKPIVCTNSKGKKLGFISREQKEEVTKLILKEYKATVHKITKWSGPTGCTIKVEPA